MKKLLVVGASILQLPAIKCARALGYNVGVVDYNPKAIGISYADNYFNVSTIDIEGITKVAKEYKPDGIITLATDMPMRAIAVATTELGLPGISYDTAIKTTDKGQMIKAFKDYGVESPWYYIVENEGELSSIADSLTYPCIIKPTDNSGSRGVILIQKCEELYKAYKYSKNQSRNGAVIIEEYMCGNEVSVEIICIEGEPNVLAVTDKLTTGAPHFVEMGHSQQSELGFDNIEKIKKVAKQAVKAVGIQNGPAHVEIMMTKDGPKMIELGARMGGDCITSHLVPLSTGIDMIEATIRLACNEITKISISQKFKKGSAIRYIPSACGRIKQIHGIDDAMNIEGVTEIFLNKNVGDFMTNVKNSADRFGFIIAQADTAQEAIKACENSLQKIKIEVCSDNLEV